MRKDVHLWAGPLVIRGMGAADPMSSRPRPMTPRWRSRKKLEEHFVDHEDEFGGIDIDEYAASALDTIDVGKPFWYGARGTGARRRGYFDPATGRFTATSPDGRRIFTHFIPTAGEQYVRDLPHSDYV